jgi:cytochrome bd-type quinol oxidase subunit 2
LTFHYLFAVLTMGLALFVAWMKTVSYLGREQHRLAPLRHARMVARYQPSSFTAMEGRLRPHAHACRRVASCALIAGLLSTAAAGPYPNVPPARERQPFGLTIHNAASGDHALGSPSPGGG